MVATTHGDSRAQLTVFLKRAVGRYLRLLCYSRLLVCLLDNAMLVSMGHTSSIRTSWDIIL
jgi:hypothetical protein